MAKTKTLGKFNFDKARADLKKAARTRAGAKKIHLDPKTNTRFRVTKPTWREKGKAKGLKVDLALVKEAEEEEGILVVVAKEYKEGWQLEVEGMMGFWEVMLTEGEAAVYKWGPGDLLAGYSPVARRPRSAPL